MRSLQSWLDEYGQSHQNSLNKKIHWICVPLILWSILTLLSEIRFGAIHAGWIASLLATLYYARLSFKMALTFVIVITIMMLVNELIFTAINASRWLVALIVFALAWIGQFYGHAVEGKKPSFLKDVQFLLIGPLWLMHQAQKSNSSKPTSV